MISPGLLLFAVTRERLAGYYAGVLLAFILLHLGYSGAGLAWLWTAAVQDHVIGIGMLLYASLGGVFSLRAQSRRQESPRFWRGLRGLPCF